MLAITYNAAKGLERSRKISKKITQAVKQQQSLLIEQQRPGEAAKVVRGAKDAMKESIKTAK